MSRLTISLPDDLHRALKRAAATRGSTIGELVAESLEHYGVKSEEDARALVAAARRRSGLDPAAAEKLAITETRRARGR